MFSCGFKAENTLKRQKQKFPPPPGHSAYNN